jgi:hypothetical protein
MVGVPRMGPLVIGADMLRELGRLRDAERCLKERNFAEALALVRDPAVADHRRAVEVRAAARAGLLDAARTALREGRVGDASHGAEVLRRDGPGEGLDELERACRDARRNAQANAAARDSVVREAKKCARGGDRRRAHELLQGLEGADADQLRKELEELERREAAWAADVAAAVERRDFAAVDRAFDAPAAAAAPPATLAALFGDAAARALRTKDVDHAARLFGRLRERTLEPADLREPLGSAAVDAAERRIADADLAGAGAALAVFPLGGAADDAALRLRRGIWAWQRGREAFRRGQDPVGRALYDEADELLPRSPARNHERKEAAQKAEAVKEAVVEARRLCTAGRLKAAREKLASALGEAPQDHVARELVAALDLDLQRDDEALAEAREALAALDLRAARRSAAGLSLRRSDLAEVELLLHEIEARSERALLDAVDAERRTVLSPPARGRSSASGRPLPAEEPFLLRIENEGDWLVHPASSLWIGCAAKKQADLRVLAAIGARHARIDRLRRPDGGCEYRLVAGDGQPVSINRTEAASATLKDGDLVQLGRAFAFTFVRPTEKTGSATLKLHGDFSVHGCSRILLFHEDGRSGAATAAGPGVPAHVALRGTDERFELYRSDDADSKGQLLLRSPHGVAADGAGERAQVRAAAGVVYAVGALKFYLDPLPGDRD